MESKVKNLTIWVLRFSILTGLSFACLLAVSMTRPKLLAGVPILIGCSNGCDINETTEAMGWPYEEAKTVSAIHPRVLRSDGKLDFVTTQFGDYWVRHGDVHGLGLDLVISEQRADIYRTSRLIAPGDIVLDCGAEYGTFTRKALESGAGLVVAIEPSPDTLEALRRNLRSEISEGRVIVYPKGVWDKGDVLTMNVDPVNSAVDSIVLKPPTTNQGPRIELTTIDELVSDLRLQRVDFIKMDIEGAERNALKGGMRTLTTFHPRMAICVYHLPGDPEVISALAHRAYPNYRQEQLCERSGRFSTRPKVRYYF